MVKLGPLISVIGCEGAGKSTTVENVHSKLTEKGIPASTLFFGRGMNNIIPINKWGKGYKKKQQAKPRPITTKKKLLNSVFSSVYAVDLLLRYAFHILPKRLKGEAVITDRYVSDLYNMRNVPLAVRKTLLALFPRPSMTFYLYNSIETMHQRKQRDWEDLQWQIRNFESVLNKRFKAIPIKTDDREYVTGRVVHEVTQRFYNARQN